MPELIEVEQYRGWLDTLCGSTVACVEVPDQRFIRGDRDGISALVGTRLASTSRHGKLLIASFADSARVETLDVGLRFGMTGRLLVDGIGPIDTLQYESVRNDVEWDRLRIVFEEAVVVLRDQRMLGSIEVPVRRVRLGPEASTVSAAQIASLTTSRSPLKTVLLNQEKIAGLGNLLVDETLWQLGLAPTAPANRLTKSDHKDLACAIRTTVKLLTDRGGSHRGDSYALRHKDARCTRCDTAMRFDRIAGRGTWWCDGHQTQPHGDTTLQ